MRQVRRLVPTLAALLAVLIVVQTADLVACADEAVAAEHSETHTDAPLVQGAHDVPAPGGSHDDSGDHEDGTFADCLCHVVFAPTAVVPTVDSPHAGEPLDVAFVANAPPEVEPQGPEHVPLA